MLLPGFLGSVADRVVDLWEQLNMFGVRDMARRIADAENHMTASADWQKYKMEQAGASAVEIRKKVRDINKLSEKEVKEVFEEAVLRSFENDSKVFEDAGMDPPPFNGEEGRKLLQTLYDQTNGELYNFTRTTANQSQRVLIKALDDAMLRVTSGLQSKEMAIQQAIEAAAADGLYVEYPSGHRDTIEVAVRRAVQTGVNQASLRMCVNECETVGTNYVIVSSHLGARTGDTPHADHSGWQGGIYRLKDRKEGFWGMFEEFRDVLKGTNYPLLEEATGYPSDPLGLGGYNCRHNMMPYFPGISENHMQKYDQKENEEAYRNSQRQRVMERRMRALRRQIEALKAASHADEASNELRQQLQERRKELEGKYKKRLEDYRKFCKDNGLNPATERTYTSKAANKITEQSGALNDQNDPAYEKRDQIAKRLYKEIKNRKREYEIKAIARNTGLPEADVDKAFAHVFERRHYSRLFGKVRFFDPDYYMAQSWMRLLEGKNILEHDMIMIRHEIEEERIMGDSLTIPYEDAHKEAEKLYNYREALNEYRKNNGL